MPATLNAATRTAVTVRVMRDNVIDAYELADLAARSNGGHWYADARAYAVSLASVRALSIECTAGIIAALSPRTSWRRNIAAAEILAAGGTPVGILGRSVADARAILAGAHPLDVLNGPKVRAFYHAILSAGRRGTAVIDAHATRIATRGQFDTVAPCRYADVAEAYALAAEVLSIPIHTVQAVTWCAARGTAE